MELHVLRRHGWSISALAREFGLNRRTVVRELAAEGPRRYRRRASTTELSPAQLAHVHRRLEVCPGIRGTTLYAELRADYGFAASYATCQRLLRPLRPAVVREPEIRYETGRGVQTQADWAHLGLWPLGEHLVELYAMVAILGCSRAPAIRFATDLTRPTSFERLVRCLDDLGGVTAEILTDRDPVFCIGSTSDGRAILAPEWVDLCALLGTVPRACRPYRAKTKGKVERMVRELKESFLAWLSNHPLPPRPTLDDYDAAARRWIEEVVLRRRHRTTKQVVGDAWVAEEPHLVAIPQHVLASVTGSHPTLRQPAVVDLTQRLLGEHVEVRSLDEYEAAL